MSPRRCSECQNPAGQCCEPGQADAYAARAEAEAEPIHPSRIIDPRGPVRYITAIDERTDGTAITCNCGHTCDRNQTFTYQLGAAIRCFECRECSDNLKPAAV